MVLGDVLHDDQTFADVLERFHALKHTGAVVIHFAQGHAVRLELPCEPVRIKLDTQRKKA